MNLKENENRTKSEEEKKKKKKRNLVVLSFFFSVLSQLSQREKRRMSETSLLFFAFFPTCALPAALKSLQKKEKVKNAILSNDRNRQTISRDRNRTGRCEAEEEEKW